MTICDGLRYAELLLRNLESPSIMALVVCVQGWKMHASTQSEWIRIHHRVIRFESVAMVARSSESRPASLSHVMGLRQLVIRHARRNVRKAKIGYELIRAGVIAGGVLNEFPLHVKVLVCGKLA
jgi:hypothetical protein